MKLFIFLFALLFSISSFAQTGTSAPLLLEGSNFFVCIIAGILLAMAFQLVLTILSVAGGTTAVGDIEKKGHKTPSNQHPHQHSHDEGGMNVAQKISTGAGIWMLLTTSIALFFASLIAVKLSMIGANFIGASLGLIIWAAFYVIMCYIEMSAISSALGGAVSSIKHGFSSTFSAFSKSKESTAKEVAKTSAKEEAKAMRKQFEKLFDTHDVDKKVDDYIKQLKPQKIDIHSLKKEIKDLLTHIQVTEKADFNDPNEVKRLILEEAEKSKLSKEDQQAVKDHVNGLKDISNKNVSNEEKAKQGIEEFTNADRQQIDKYQEQIKEALKNTHKDSLQPEQLESDLKKILNQPGEASNIIKAKASAMDRQTLVKLASSQNLSEQEANKYVDQVEGVLQKVNSFFGSTGRKASSSKEDLKAKIKDIFSGTGSSLHLDTIYSDFTNLFRGSAGGPDLKYKLKHYNKEEMLTLITHKTSLSRTEADPIAEKIVSARDNVIEKADEVEAKVNEKMAETKQKALEAAEETRKAAVTTSWWMAATAIVSAAASAVGGMLALESWFY